MCDGVGMKFVISRTSLYEEKPCEEAFRDKVTYLKVHERACKTFEEYDHRFSKHEGAWLSKGTNHRLTQTGIYREEGNIEEESWFIEINSLEELINFQDKYGSLVLEKWKDGNRILQLEIYDTYRE